MDWDLWDPLYNQVARESSYHMGHGSQCDFYFGYGFDVIEENALNEKSCVQVLRILIKKADTEIVELEENLVVLQSQLAWAEHNKYEAWPEVFCAALREKINCLDISIRSLKNENVQNERDFDVRLQMHREPADRIHEIVKALLRNYFQEKDEQPADIIVKDSSSAARHAIDLSKEMKRLSNSDSKIIRKEEVKEQNVTPTEKCTIVNSSLKPLGKRTNYPDIVKLANTIVRDCIQDSSRHAAGHSEEKNILSDFDLKGTRMEEAKEHEFTPTNKNITHNSSLNPEEKRRSHLETPANIIVENSNSDVPKQATGYSNEKEKLSNSDTKISSEEVKENSSAPTATILDSSLKPEGKRIDLEEKVKPENTIIESSSWDALRHETGNSDKKKLSKLDLKVIGKAEVKGHSSPPIDKRRILNSCLKPGGKGTNLSKTVEPANSIAKESNSDSTRRAISTNGKEKLSKFSSKVIVKEEVKEHSSISTDKSIILNSSMEPGGEGTHISEGVKSADIIVKDSKSDALRQATRDNNVKLKVNEGPKVAPTDKIDSSNSSLKTEGKRTNSVQKAKVQEADLTDTEHTALNSLLELQDHNGKDSTKSPKEVWRPQPKEVPKAEIPAIDDLNLSPKPQRQRAKRKIQSNLLNAQGPGFSPPETGFNSSSISKAKRRPKSRIGNGNASLNQSPNRKNSKKLAEPDLCGAEKLGVAPDLIVNLVSKSQKKRKKSSIVGIKDPTVVDINLSELHGETTDSTGKEDLPVTESCSTDDSHNETMKSTPSTRLSNLMDLTVTDLKAIAKQQNMRKYSMLRKAELAEQLAEQLANRPG